MFIRECIMMNLSALMSSTLTRKLGPFMFAQGGFVKALTTTDDVIPICHTSVESGPGVCGPRMKKFNVEWWRLYCALPWVHGSYAEVVSQNMRMKLSEYERSIKHHVYLTKYITLPQEWKDSDEDSSLFSFVLLQSVDRYIDYFKSSAVLIGQPIDFFVRYASAAEIGTLPFPVPQLISNELDAKKYQARIYKAFLHMFSYPGLTTCRCEMESERVTALLFHSFFDWFGTISSSNDGKSDSIKIFKRFPIPTWTTDGFAPIVFMSQPLQSWSKEKQFGHVLVKRLIHDREAPPFLIPLLSAVQPALQALVVREITKWTKSRKTSEEQFNLPDWLFIHGLFYDATEIQVYTCTPRITECDANGVPSKWHFACFPMEPYYFRPFSHRDTAIRLTAAVSLLKIQRHTTRICNELHNLTSDPVDVPVQFGSASPEIKTFTVPVLENNADPNVDIEGRQVKANTSLLQCMARAGVCPSSCACFPNEWAFLATPQINSTSSSFLTAFLQNWRSTSGLLSLPEDWIKPAPEPSADEEHFWNWRSFQTEAESQLKVWMSPQKEKFIPISEKELHARHFSPDSFAPDFYLSVPARKHRHDDWDKLRITDLSPQTMMHVPEHFKDVIQYAAYEVDAKFAMSSLFMCTPGCWLKCDTESRFPSALGAPSGPVDFSLLLHPIQTVPIDMTPLTPDVALRATILNPALVIGTQGPNLWPPEFLHPSSHIRPKNKTEALTQLAAAIEPSLKTHLINWQLRFEQGLTPSRELPPWFMLFGIIYDAQEVIIVAHIPYLEASSKYSYKSCIVDTISFPLAIPSSKVTDPWYLDRFRVGLALLSIQKHAFHMAQLWEGVVWPNDLISWEEIIEREHLGPVLTPSDRGYMTTPDPMYQLYREMHGSDETLDDCTPTVTCDNNAFSFKINEGGLDTTQMEHSADSGADTSMNDRSDQCCEKESPGTAQDQTMYTEEDVIPYWLHCNQSQQSSEGE